MTYPQKKGSSLILAPHVTDEIVDLTHKAEEIRRVKVY
jgi:hypothetical protein